jgi:hypothetical protein
MARQLTERQQAFLNVLFEEGGGDMRTAMRLAGYSDATAISEVTNSLKDEIIDHTQSFLSRNAPRAAMAMVGVVSDPTALGNRDKLAAANQILDRTGLVKTEKVSVEASGGVILLPPKQNAE